MSEVGTIPRRLIELGGAVEETGGLWHIAQSEILTYCGEYCSEWPRVARAVERCGIWCGPCLMEASSAYEPECRAKSWQLNGYAICRGPKGHDGGHIWEVQ